MNIKILDQNEGIKQLVSLAISRQLIPFFGSGFTVGCRAFRKKVPDGKQATEIMNKIILNSCDGKITKDELSDNFNETSDLFFESVTEKEQSNFLSNYFINVTIEDYKKTFLKINWPYAYTINVDDGIENTGEFTPILPYKKLKKNYNASKYLYKIHGDAKYETNYDEENIVFRTSQYINSIKSKHNLDFLNNITNDYMKNNIIFIGCSMCNEPDLKFIFEQLPENSNNIRAVIRKEKPTYKQQKLLLSHGVNEVIIVNDFDLFYKKFIEQYYNSLSDHNYKGNKYANIKIEKIDENSRAIECFSGRSIYDSKNNVFYKIEMHIARSVMQNISEQLELYDCVVLKGRRFSGKTYLLATIYEYFNRFETYFFTSQIQLDSYYIKELLQKNNSLFIFDSNSISPDVYKLISASKDIIKENKNKILISTNSNDNYIIGALDAGLVELQSYFDEYELEKFNYTIDRYGLIRRNKFQTNLDYLQKLSKEQKIRVPMLNEFSNKANFAEQVLLFLLAVNDKIYYSDAIALDIMPDYINGFLNNFQILVEEVPTEVEEKASHSSTKIIYNSKMVILELVQNNKKNDIIDIIKYIVIKLKDDLFRERIYINVILFDTLNQIFGGKSGAGSLIFEVYNSLEELLCDSPDYWLQRAKSIYRISSDDINKLYEAYQYAKKAYFDGDYNMKLKSSLTISLICGYVCSLLDDESDNKEKHIECIQRGYEAAFSNYYNRNQRYLNNELRGGRMRRNSYNVIISVCKYVIENGTYDCSIVDKAKRLKNKLETIQSEYYNRE